ncbi:hypothetical protein E6O75_ATG10164 [Venturia nashicola]|uniref:Secreted protein n=1 Tax=Venturia nashicola TaxID=86259 RepID=A0A4Z1NCF7_9PEZI|nr:hypothetical protein E6O75_ATG10164 [Venturia nashicola]
MPGALYAPVRILICLAPGSMVDALTAGAGCLGPAMRPEPKGSAKCVANAPNCLLSTAGLASTASARSSAAIPVTFILSCLRNERMDEESD